MSIRKIVVFLTLILASSCVHAQYQPNPDGWNFYNFLTTEDEDELWDIYTRSFLGVAQNKSSASAEDIIFFDEIITGYGGHASCFGMSLLSLICFHEGGHLGACSPVYRYEGDLSSNHDGPDLDIIRESISIMHLRQLTQPMISALIDLFNDNNWNDPQYAYNQIQTSIASGDFPLLSFMPSSMEAINDLGDGAEAHTVVPYSCMDTGTHLRIYIYDPNFPYSTESGFYTGATTRNYIDIKKSGATHPWKYPSDYTPGNYGWEGSTIGPWTFLASNVSDAKYKDNHPLSVGYITGEIGTLIFSSGGTAEQITDEEGRRFYKKQAGKLEIEKDPSKKTNNIIRWPFLHGKRHVRELYFMKNIGGKSYEIQVEAKGKEYTAKMLLHGNVVTLKMGKSKAGRDKIKIQSTGTSAQTMEISSSRALKNVSMEMFRKLPDQRIRRTFKITDLDISKDSPVIFRIVDRMNALQVENPKEAISYKVELIQTFRGKTSRLSPKKVTSPAGEVQKVRPSTWKNLKKSTIDIKARKLRKKP